MPNEFLNNILEHKRRLNQEKAEFFSSIKSKLDQTDYTRYFLFKRMISKEGQVNLIAEVKKASPSVGMIREEFDHLGIAKIYVEQKAAAVSVLTEEKYFLGKPIYVQQISSKFNVPVLTKDFFIEEGQIYEARYNGASAILLIVSILDQDQLKNLYQRASALDLDCLVEIHDEAELERALEIDAEIIGVNNRNLHTFEVDIATSERLIPKIPKGKVVVAESGIRTHDDVEKLHQLGAHAVLIGETFMKAKDIKQKIDEVFYGRSNAC